VATATDAPLVIAAPDPQTIYQISPRLPRASQRIPLRSVAHQPVEAVTYYLNGQLVGTATESPYEIWWALEPGTYELQARGRLASGETVASPSVSFVVNP
jgi:membrane carboxypeptidase/penicillin-binding protein PbpC